MTGSVGRPRHEPTAETHATVKALAAYGIPRPEIGRRIGINQDTLLKYYRDDLDLGAVEAHAAVGQYLFTLASGRALASGATHADCGRAAMFWAKTRMGWRETNNLEHSGVNGGPIEIVRKIQRDAAVKAALRADG